VADVLTRSLADTDPEVQSAVAAATAAGDAGDDRIRELCPDRGDGGAGLGPDEISASSYLIMIEPGLGGLLIF
jgi:hypothetical protein